MSLRKGCVYVYHAPSDGKHWAEYLRTKFDETEYNIPSTLIDIGSLQEDHMIHDVNVVLISPEFFNLPSLKCLNRLDKQKSLGVLLGTDEAEYRQTVASRDCLDMLEWQIIKPKAEEVSVRNLLKTIINLYEDVHKDDVTFDTDEEDPYDFLPAPKPLQANMSSGSEVPSDGGCSSNKLYAILSRTTRNTNEIFLVLDGKPISDVKVISEINDTEYRVSPLKKEIYVVDVEEEELSFKVMDGDVLIDKGAINFKSDMSGPSQSFDTTEHIDNSEISDLDKLRELLLKETDPICMLCRALRLKEESSEALDHFMTERCKQLRSLRSLQRILISDSMNATGSSSQEQWPTLLHFCAEYNLINFCKELLTLPNSLESCNIMNCDKEVPFDIAHHKKHEMLANLLKEYMEQHWGDNTPGNKDSGIEQEPPLPLPHGSEYMQMDNREKESNSIINESLPPVPHPESSHSIINQPLPPLPHLTSTYMDMKSISDAEEDINDDSIFGDDLPAPTPHTSNKSYANIHQSSCNVEKDNEIDTYMQMGQKVEIQPHAQEMRRKHLKKSHSESDAKDFEQLSRLGYDVQKKNKDSDDDSEQQEDYELPVQSRWTRSSSEGHTPMLHKSKSYSYVQPVESEAIPLPKQPQQKKSFIKKIFHRPRKNSLATDPDQTIHEEKTQKRDKKKDKSKNQDHPDGCRISDISTTSSGSSSSTDSHPVSSTGGKHSRDHSNLEKSTGLVPRRESKKQHPKRRKSKRIVRLEKDQELHVIDLPSKSSKF